MSRIILLNQRYEVRHHGCEKCGRGTESLEFVPRDENERPQVLTGEVAECVWDAIKAELHRYA